MKANTNIISSLTLVIFYTATCLLSLSYSKLCNPKDKNVLLKIKRAFNYPYSLASWDPETDCCKWYGIKCNETSGRVRSLFVHGGDTLEGPIPPQVGDLPYLESLNFYKCPNIIGLVPSSIGKLKHLRILMITNCKVSGIIPRFLGRMATLEFISFAFNRLSGSIPSSLGNLPNLTSLRLDHNKLTGSIPKTFGSFKGDDFYLHLSHNQLSGEIPTSLGKKVFSYIDLSGNRLEGDASFLFGRDKKTLWHMDLSRNSLLFEFSEVEFPETLVYLAINHNKIFGSLPQDLVKLELQSFDVSYNCLCGEIPYGGRLQQFDASAYDHNKCLCGPPLPECDYMASNALK